MGIQLSHSGRKAWSEAEGIGPERCVAPSPIPFHVGWPTPRELSSSEVRSTVSAFGRAAALARQACLDVIELHGAHGHLIHQFLSPISNRRTDQYGGSADGRLRFLLEVVESVREGWGDRPLFVRLSATDYVEGGIDLDQTVETAKVLRQAGVDLIDVSSGGVTPRQPSRFPGYHAPFSQRIRTAAGVPTAVAGLISHPELAEEIVCNGRADLVVLGRELLRSPHWPLEAARAIGAEVRWPAQYERAR